MAALPEDVSVDIKVAIDELESAITEVESRLESTRAERDEATARQAELEQENARLRHELSLAREQQSASADVLSTIANSSDNADHALRQIAETSARLFGATSATIQIAEGDSWVKIIRVGDTSKRVGETVPVAQLRIGGNNMPGTIVAENRQVHVPDLDNVDPAIAGWPGLAPSRAAGTRSMSGSPLRREGKAIGALIVYRDRLAPFTGEEMLLQQSFADQAAIAIENSRLINETRESLERQTATADILKVIASSPADVQPVFEAIAISAKNLLDGFSATVLHFIADELHLAAFTPTNPEADEGLQASFPRRVAEFPIFQLVRDGATIQFPDTEAENVPAMNRDLGRLRGFRSVLFVPLMNRGQPVGILSVTRTEPGAFAGHHLQLLQTFADQAVIAIENTRLFNETKEALERQTATADILKVIASSPSDTTPVFEAIANSANRLLGAFSTVVFRFVDGTVHLAAFTPTKPAADEELVASFPMPVDYFEVFRLAHSGQPISIPDTEEMTYARIRELARLRGFRSILYVPLMNSGVPIGIIAATRAETGAFAPHHIQLLQTFADQAVIAIENTRLFNETREALERQTATADILKVIASSPSDVQPVFDAIAHSAKRLIGGFSTAVHRVIDDIDHLVAFTPTNPESDEVLKAAFPRHRHEMPAIISLVENGETAQIADSEVADKKIRKLALARGWRSASYTPLMNQGTFIGFIVCTRRETGMLADHHVQLLRTFADQAVIAIENARLFNETREALERQTATADILKVIASSPSDVQPVFDAIAHSANRLIGGFSAAVFRYIDGKIHLASFTPTDTTGDAVLQSSFPVPLDQFPPYQLTREGAWAELPDTEVEPAARDIARARGYRSMLFAPLMNDGEAVGIITVTRVAPGSFGEQHVRLLQMFADQAVIAIKNVGLFNEVQARTEELSESLQQQTAVGDVLKTISRSTFDLQPVLDTLVNTAALLCNAEMAFIMRREGDVYRAGAAVGYTEAYVDFLTNHPLVVDRGTVTGRAVLERRPVQILDVVADPEYTLHQTTSLSGQRTTVGVPLLRENEPIGVIVLARRRVESFSEKQIDLVATFADQAVIAIENVRLFDEVRQRTEDLSEALQQQTATADVLKVISRSAFDLETVLNTLTESAARLCNADLAAITRQYPDGGYYHATRYNFSPEWERLIASVRLYPDRGSLIGRVLLTSKSVQIPDALADPEYSYPEHQRVGGYRTLLGVPMLRSGQPIGVLFLGRQTVEPFSDRQIELVQTFADQAVIAIENVRLFDEVQAKTRDLSEALTYQTASGNILGVIASSPTDVQPALKAIVESACELCNAYDANVLLKVGDDLHYSAHHGPIPTGREKRPINRDWVTGRSVVDRVPVQVSDFQSPEAAEFPEGQRQSHEQGHRCTLSVPLLREGESIGAIVLRRLEPVAFNEKQIALLRSFADQAVIAIGNVRLFDEVQARTRDLSEALQQQTATADVLKVISRSAFDLETVLDALLSSACRLCDADIGTIRYREDGEFRLAATFGCPPEWIEHFQRYSTKPDRSSVFGRTITEGHIVHIPDLLADPDYKRPEAQKLMGFRAALGVPLARDGEAFGVINLFRFNVSSFEDRQIELVQTFADQAVIAIENVRLFDEVQARTRDLSEALTYQTGSANILKVIASSPTDVAPVLNAIVESACELCEADDAVVLLKDGDHLRFRAHHGPIPVVFDELRVINRNYLAGRSIIDKVPIHVRDVFSEEGVEFPESRELSRGNGIRSILCVPLLRENESIGTILLRRTEVNPFDAKQIALLQTFADQAVIAIGNVRLFEEVQAKTRELSEALTYQTGSANILKVIASSPTDIKPVLHAIVESACELCGAYDAVLRLKKGDKLELGAHHGTVPADWNLSQINPYWTAGRAALEKSPVHVHDMSSSEGDEFPEAQARALEQGHRTILSVPMLQEANSIGTLTLRRLEVNPFTDKQVALLQTFADQAVIAIGNVRLFEEVQARTRELSESLQFQTASSDVLKVISRSPDALQPVLDAIVETSRELCESDGATIVLFRDRKAHFVAVAGVLPQHFEFLRDNPASIDEPGSLFERMVREKRTLHLPNVMDDPEISQKSRTAMGGPRALLVAPLLRDGEPVGAIVLRQSHLKPFMPRQIQAIEVFADQAVIAISNVELFEQVQQRTRELTESLEQQTATSEVLGVISRSAGDLQPVFQSMLENATRICSAQFGLMNLREGDYFRTVAFHNVPPEFLSARKDRFRVRPDSVLAQMVRTRQFTHTPDLRASPLYAEGDPPTRHLVDLAGARTLLVVPMLKDSELVGTIGIYRHEVLPFNEKQIALLGSFASQAVIAIENTRLLNELRQRTDDLTVSLENLRTAQDRLVQTEKLASLGQLTAGIAHEIKNPLNFVNNFAALSAELTGELNDVLKKAEITEKIRAEVDELTGLLKDNLEKVVQHGKRADSIVKNMLLHSREGGGDHRPADINALIDESLNLAYHGARAEKPDFNVTLQRDFDPSAGMLEIFPQEISRVFLNLVSNGFYAVTKRRKEHGEAGFEPTLRATTKNLGDSVEIRIRDNGTGIPPEVKEKMFNPFFTTKPAGEGTGLGLSMSHDIIVKQHGGTIDVDSEPGHFTEFRIVLPRSSNFSDKSRG